MTQGHESLLEHWPAMVRVCQRTLGSREDAEDCAATALLGVVQRGGLENVENNEAWMVSIAKRRAVDVLRARVREQGRAVRLAAEHEIEAADVAELIVERAEARWLKETADSAVPEKTSQLVHALTEGMSISEAAAHLGMTKRAAESHLHRARIALRAVWAASLALIGWACALLRKAAPTAPQIAVAAVAAVTLGTLGPQPPAGGSSPPGASKAVVADGTSHTPAEARPSKPVTRAAPAEARRQAAPPPAAPRPDPRPRRVGTRRAGLDVVEEQREGPTDPVGIVLHCLTNAEVTTAHVGC